MVSRKKRIKIIKGKVKAQARKNNREGQVKKKVGTGYIYPVTGHVVGLDTETGELEKTAFNGGLLIQNGRVETTRKR